MFDLQDDKSFRFTVSFARRSEPEGQIVTETCGNTKTDYGPMPEDIVLPFIEERKAFWQKLAETQLSRFHNDFGCFGSAEMVWPPAPNMTATEVIEAEKTYINNWIASHS